MNITTRSLVVAAALAITPDAIAQCRLPGPAGTAFGAIDGRRAIVGGGYPTNPPSVRLYEKTSQGWVLDEQIAFGDTVLGYPLAVAMHGNRCLVGSAESNGQMGRAMILERVGASWVPTPLIPLATSNADFFGATVALDDDIAVVGASHDPIGGGDGIPRVHVFEHNAGTWTETALPAGYDSAIGVAAGTFLVGNDDASPGHVDVYEKIAGGWFLTQTLTHAAPPSGPWLGASLAIESDTLVVGAAWPYHPNTGRVEVFRHVGGSWQWVQTVVSSQSTAGGRFGSSVALSGSTLLVGAPTQGRVRRFEHDGTSFVEVPDFDPEGTPTGLGYAVAVQGEDAILSGNGSSYFYRLGFAHTSSFCPATPNSTGARGVLSVEGCDSRSGEQLTLVSNRLPPAAIGIVFFGLNTAQQPLGDGTLCIGAPLRRLPISVADHSGRMVHDVDFGTWPGSSLAAGRTWKFQTVFRDPGIPGHRLNLTNALAIPMTP